MTENAMALAADAELYAKVIEGIIVVADDWKPGDPERREPRETLLKCAAFIRATSQPCDGALREALESLAKLPLWQDTYPDGPDIIAAEQIGSYFTTDDIRAARAALALPVAAAPIDAVREALVKAREEIVLVIAFLGRDTGTSRIDLTVNSLISRLVKADAAALDALSASPVAATTRDAVPFDLTNHHNALKCPYCNPDGRALSTPTDGANSSGVK